MLKNISSNRKVQKIIAFLASAYLKLVYSTSRIELIGRNKIEIFLNKKESFIYSFWHDQLLFCPLTWQSTEIIKVLISKHRDGDIITKVIDKFGFKAIRGSTHKPTKTKNKGSLVSARQVIKSLQNGVSIGIAPDGPKGPRHEVSDGIIQISKLSHKSILPVAIGFQKKWVLNTWDQFIIPRPFNNIRVIWGNPINFKSETKKVSDLKIQLEKKMNQLTKEANKNL